MDGHLPNLQTFHELNNLCRKLIENPKDLDSIGQLNELIENSPPSFIKIVQLSILSTFYPVMKSVSENKTSFSVKEKQMIFDTLRNVFEKSKIKKLGTFTNMYGFLLSEIYDYVQHKVLPIHEEYKLSIMECTKSLAKSISFDLTFELYTKTNAPKLCQMIYVAIEIAKTEQLKSLRVSAIECIMCLARLFDDDDFQDVVVRKQVSEVFLFFLPGVACGLKKIALEDEIVGHKVPMVALRAWGRIITLLMQDYNLSSTLPSVFELKHLFETAETSQTPSKKRTNTKDVLEHLKNSSLSPQWYNDTDEKLQHLVLDFMKLTHHSHRKVRSELSDLCTVVLGNCLGTMPLSSTHLIEIVITLTEDTDPEISRKSKDILMDISSRLTYENLKTLLESLEEGFINGINTLPRKFNGIDEMEQLASLNLLIGYLNVFGQHQLNHVLLSGNYLNNLLMTIIHVSELEKSGVGLFEEYSVKELDLNVKSESPWKKFCHFKDDRVRFKLEKLCRLLGEFGVFRMVSDFLLDIIMYDAAHRKEAILILNEVVTGVDVVDKNNVEIIKNIVDTYTENRYLQIPFIVTVDEDGNEITLIKAQHNAVQVCLLVEGIGKIALILKEDFNQFMFKILYIVLEKAGSSHSLVRAAGLSALKNVTIACGYSNVTDLITKNIDYFSFHVERRLNRSENKENVLGVLSVVLKYSTMDVLQYLSYTIQEVLVQSCDKFKDTHIKAYLELFKVFIKSLRRWLNVEIREDPIVSKAEKNREIEKFTVIGVGKVSDDFSDEKIMGKSAEEMFEEDRKNKMEETEMETEEPEVEDLKKPEPPLHVKLVVSILQRSLNFLPSKDRLRKLLVLELLSNGLEVIRDWEDELLPIVHQIWSPFVQRFKEYNDPLIINYSFRLLSSMARLSKEFIRMRTSKEVLPSILEILDKLSKDSHLKDKGSVYRYSQAFKLQLTILEDFAKILIRLDVTDDDLNKAIGCVRLYLSNKQPMPLQNAATGFFQLLAEYDPELVLKNMNSWEQSVEFEKNLKTVLSNASVCQEILK